MKIKSLDIKGFGRLSELKISPGAGFNMIYAHNEAGKSTLQAFIRAMFYGLKGGRKLKDGTLPPLKQYKPWNAGQYAGVMEYALENGDTYRVGRNFDKGTANIYDQIANNVTAQFAQERDVGPRFAEEHLGIDEASFERSVFIGQLQCAIDDDGRKALLEKLSNLSATGNEDLSLTQAVAALENTLLERVGTGRSASRPLDRVKLRLSELEQKQRELSALAEQYLDTVRSLHEQKSLLKDLTRELEEKQRKKEISRASKLRALNQELENLTNRAAMVERELEKCANIMAELESYGSVTEHSLSKMTLLLHDHEREKELTESESARLEDLKNRQAALQASLDPDEIFQKRMNTVDEALESYKLLKERQKNQHQRYGRNSAPANSGWITAIFFLTGCMVLLLASQYIKNPSPLLLGSGISIIAIFGILLSYFNIRKSRGRLTMKTDADLLNRALSEAGFDTMNDYIRYRESQLKTRDQLESIHREIDESKARLHSLKTKCDTYERELDDILAHDTALDGQKDRAFLAESLKRGAGRLKEAKEREQILISQKASMAEKFEMVLREAGTLANHIFPEYHDFKVFLGSLPQTDGLISEDSASELQLGEELETTTKRIEQAKLEIAALNTRLEQAPTEGELTEIAEETALLQDKREKLEMMGGSLNLAKEILTETAQNLQRDYVPALNDQMSTLMSELTSGRYKVLRTNDKLQINLEAPETDELISVSRLSGGTIDQVYLCMRLAAVLLLEKGRERLPLFLDEPFLQYDETRMLQAFKLLKKISGDRQVFFFTCRTREFEMAQSVFNENMTLIDL